MFLNKRFNCTVLVFVFALSIFCLFGCGKKSDPKLDAYKDSMTSFYDKLSYLDGMINGIDPEFEGAKYELLKYLDEMNDAYQDMAAIEVPEEFSGIAQLAVEASEYMQKANEFYHLAYDNEFDDESEMLASQYYERANNRVVVILQVLHGEIPEGEGIEVETEDTYEIDTIPVEDTEGE